MWGVCVCDELSGIEKSLVIFTNRYNRKIGKVKTKWNPNFTFFKQVEYFSLTTLMRLSYKKDVATNGLVNCNFKEGGGDTIGYYMKAFFYVVPLSRLIIHYDFMLQL